MLYMSCVSRPFLGVKHFPGGSDLLGVGGQTVNNKEFHVTTKKKKNYLFTFF